jgi:hypothetical protein
VGSTAERGLPADLVNKDFVGDRYADYADHIPRDADFAMQAPVDLYSSRYLWWLPDPSPATQLFLRATVARRKQSTFPLPSRVAENQVSQGAGLPIRHHVVRLRVPGLYYGEIGYDLQTGLDIHETPFRGARPFYAGLSGTIVDDPELESLGMGI